MGFSERLKEMRIGKALSQKELAKRCNITANAVSNYESGQNYPKLSVLIDLMSVLECTADYLYQDYLPPTNAFTLSEDERDLIQKYRKLNQHGRMAARAIIDIEYQSAEEWIAAGHLKDIDLYIPVLKSKGYTLSALPRRIKIAKTINNLKADFCLELISNAERPLLSIGEIALFKREPVPNNEIGLFRVNGLIYIRKRYFSDGETILMPFNPGTKPLVVKEDDKFEILGRYVGKLERNYIE